MINKKILPFALGALVLALNGCGGESANIIPEINDTSTENGTCASNSDGCLEFVLDYPLDGLNFTCSSDNTNKFITLFNPNESVSTGACRIGDTVTFYLMGDKDKKIELGRVNLNTISNVASKTSPPRLTLLDIASGISGQKAQSLNKNDETVKISMRLAKVIQAIALKDHKIDIATEIQPVYMTAGNRTDLEKVGRSITTADFITLDDAQFNALFTPWLDLSTVSDDDAFKVVSKLANISVAAVFQPEFALYSAPQMIIAGISGSNGLVGCDKPECKPEDTTQTNSFGHFMLMTDRQGMTFGSGVQWRGKVDSALSTIGGVNLQLMLKVKPKQMTASQQDNWIDPITHEIDRKRQLGFKFDVDEVGTEPLIIKQGTLLADKMIAGIGGGLYRALAGLNSTVALTPQDTARLGLWEQKVNQGNYKGTLDLYKQYPISYLDKTVFRTIENTPANQPYIFPLYADMTFKFANKEIKSVKLGIVIDRNGDIRTNIRPNVPDDVFTNTASTIVDLSTDTATGCVGHDVLDPLLMKDHQGTQQYRIGTVSRTFLSSYTSNPNALSIRMILADQVFGTINGALIGMNTTIKTSADSGESIVIGGALVKVGNLLNTATGTKPSSIVFTDSSGKIVKWANSYASFNLTYSQKNPTDTEAKELAKLAGGEISLDPAPCYTVKTK